MSIFDDIQASVTRALPPGEPDSRDASRIDPLGGEHAPAASTNGAYPYGPPATAVRESNFISDDNLLLWLAERENGLYGELRDHMDMSRARSKLIEDLSHLKEQVDNQSLSPEEAMAEIDALLQAYAGTEVGRGLDELLAPLRDRLYWAGQNGSMQVGMEGLVSDLSDALGSRIDALGRDDQLELIQIQSLTADIREAGQLASNLLANAAQTSNTILGNIRG